MLFSVVFCAAALTTPVQDQIKESNLDEVVEEKPFREEEIVLSDEEFDDLDLIVEGSLGE